MMPIERIKYFRLPLAHPKLRSEGGYRVAFA